MVTYMPHATGTQALRRYLHQTDPAPSLGIEPPEWCEQALCAQTDPGVFFPEKGGSTRSAKLICSLCTVRGECLEWALEIEARSAYCFGIYGGVSARDRTQMLRDLRGDVCPSCGRRFISLELHHRKSRDCAVVAS